MTFDDKKFMREAEKEVMDELDEDLDKIADQVFYKSQVYLDDINKTTDTGNLAGSGGVKSQYLKKTIYYNSSHAAPIEFGTVPHMPPVDAIEAWVKRKLGVDAKESRAVAWRIAMKIKKFGTDAQPFLRPSLNEFVFAGDLQYTLNVGDKL